jgi:hypothetical protein
MIIKCTLSWFKALISVQSADFYVSDQIIRTHWYQNDYNIYLELVQSTDFYVSDQRNYYSIRTHEYQNDHKMYLQLVQSTDFYVSDQIITIYVRIDIKMIIKCTFSWSKALIAAGMCLIKAIITVYVRMNQNDSKWLQNVPSAGPKH